MQFNPSQPGQSGQPEPGRQNSQSTPPQLEYPQPFPPAQPLPQQQYQGGYPAQPFPPAQPGQSSPQQAPYPQQPPEGTFQPPSQPFQQQQYAPQQQQYAPQQQQYAPQQPQYQGYPGQLGQPGQPMYQPQMQQQMPYAQGQPIMMMPQQIVNVNIQQHQTGMFVRILYFLFIGWWAGWIWLNIGYFFVLTVIGLPIGLVMLNRLPAVLTLKPASQSVNINITGNTTNINIGGAQQTNFFIRALYFLLVGWWAGLAWSWIAYFMFVLLVTIPVGVMMLNMLPTIITLRKN